MPGKPALSAQGRTLRELVDVQEEHAAAGEQQPALRQGSVVRIHVLQRHPGLLLGPQLGRVHLSERAHGRWRLACRLQATRFFSS